MAARAMEVTPLIPEGRQVIESYGNGRFKVSGAVYSGSVIVCPTGTLPWDVSHIDALSFESLAAAVDAEPAIEVLLIGCGSRAVPIRPALRAQLRARGVSADSMDTGAACRTYNILLSEERRVAAALIAV
jgi:uncharacterized protein